MSLSEGVHSFLDDAHRRFDRLVASLPGDASGIVVALQPAWWGVRAWVAVEVAALALGEWALQVIPGENLAGAVALLVAVLLSVQLGRGELWPGGRWRVVAGLRALLLGLNLFAVVMIPVVVNGLGHHEDLGSGRAYENGYRDAARSTREAAAKLGLSLRGRQVTNVYPYDAEGHPLVGVQLFDQNGQAINVVARPEYVDDIDNADEGRPRVFYPWTNGATQLLNVFPIPSRVQDTAKPSATAFTETAPPALTPYPFAQVPGVSLPGIPTGRQTVPVMPTPPTG
jgi:hypothetical protein